MSSWKLYDADIKFLARWNLSTITRESVMGKISDSNTHGWIHSKSKNI